HFEKHLVMLVDALNADRVLIGPFHLQLLILSLVFAAIRPLRPSGLSVWPNFRMSLNSQTLKYW
ncbi:MAG TPA: hypothetical protein VGB89_14535, partial [Bacteroidota bacterium]